MVYLALCHLQQRRAAAAGVILMAILFGVKVKHVIFRFRQMYVLKRE